MTLLNWPMVTISESAVVSAMLVSSCELNAPGVVVTAYFGGMLLIMFYHNLSSEYVTKPYRSTTVDFSMGWVYR
jgi:hypothetical protein